MTDTFDPGRTTMEVAGLTFSSQLGVGSAQWLEAEFNEGIIQVLDRFQNMTTDQINMTLLGKMVTALYIQAHLEEDPKVAQRKVAGLSLPHLLEVVRRMTALQFDAQENTLVPLTEKQVP